MAGLFHILDLRHREIVACAAAGLVMAIVLQRWTGVFVAFASGYLCFTMLLVMVIDGRHMIIPDVLSLPAIPLGLAAAAAAFPADWRAVLANHVLAAAAAGLTLYAARWLYLRLRGVIGLGLGDVKLAAAAGAWVGTDQLAMMSLLATGSALTAVLARRYLHPTEAVSMSTAIPFGSFIAPAIVIMWCVKLLQ